MHAYLTRFLSVRLQINFTSKQVLWSRLIIYKKLDSILVFHRFLRMCTTPASDTSRYQGCVIFSLKCAIFSSWPLVYSQCRCARCPQDFWFYNYFHNSLISLHVPLYFFVSLSYSFVIFHISLFPFHISLLPFIILCLPFIFLCVSFIFLWFLN